MKKSQVFCIGSAIFSVFAFSNCASKDALTYKPETGTFEGGRAVKAPVVESGGEGVAYKPVSGSYRGGGSFRGGVGFGHGGFGHGGFGHGGFGRGFGHGGFGGCN